MNISYAITVCNELEEIKKLLSLLNTYIDDNDEIVILCDISQIDLHLEDIIASISKNNIKLYKDKFSKDFAYGRINSTHYVQKNIFFK
jgi:hypothetical protein